MRRPAAVELGHSPADLVLLSFSDADLGAAAMAWRHLGAARPGLRLANLAQLRHPLSVDLYAEQVLSRAKTVIVRLLGGLDYWRYGCEEVLALCRARGIPLAVIAGDGQSDARLKDFCTVSAEHGGAARWLFSRGRPGQSRQCACVWARRWRASARRRNRGPSRCPASACMICRRRPQRMRRSPCWCSIVRICSRATSRRSRAWLKSWQDAGSSAGRSMSTA